MSDPSLLAALGILSFAVAIGLLSLNKPKGASKSRSQADGTARMGDARHRVVDSTTRMVDRRSGRGLQQRLENSGSQLRSGEWVLLVAASTAVMAGISYLLGGVIAACILVVATPVVAVALLNRNIDKRQEAFADQLPDLLQNLSSALRSGQSLPQAVASIAPDLGQPAGDELRRVVIENRIGRDLIDSFRDLAQRMNSLDFDWVVRAIDINHRTGGDLSLILRRLDSMIRSRNRVAGTVRSLTAEGRISGAVLTALPPAMMLGVQILNPGFLDPLFKTAIGRVVFIVAVFQLVVGSFWLARMSRFKF